MKCEMKSLIHSQTSTVAPLKFGNGLVIPSHTLLGMLLVIHVVSTMHHHNMFLTYTYIYIRQYCSASSGLPLFLEEGIPLHNMYSNIFNPHTNIYLKKSHLKRTVVRFIPRCIKTPKQRKMLLLSASDKIKSKTILQNNS